MELDKPLGAAGNHALAGRYATMLKSAPDFDITFTKASVLEYSVHRLLGYDLCANERLLL